MDNQVSIYCAFKEKGRFFFILVKRNKTRGEFWQPLTGGEEDFDGGDLFNTVIRETEEELGINISRQQITQLPYSFKFTTKEGVKKTEYCFGVTLSLEQKKNVCLSEEHTSIILSSDLEYLKSLLKFEENQIGMDEFIKYIKQQEITHKNQ